MCLIPTNVRVYLSNNEIFIVKNVETLEKVIHYLLATARERYFDFYPATTGHTHPLLAS
jgi:hypothetical protein